jgi:hypothetical protein
MHLFYPSLHLAHLVEDVCDCCVQINIQFKCDDLPTNECDHLLMEKETHLDVTISQRRMVSNFVKEFVRHHALN